MRQPLAELLKKSGALKALDLYWGANRLTVLTYHRVTDATLPSFDHLRPNVSASPQQFDQQMAYVARHFHVINLETLENALLRGGKLPSRPLLLTFDDGYLDNYENAFPVLKRYQLPAVIFLMTSLIGNAGLPWWDLGAYAFHHTTCTTANLPLIGTRTLIDPANPRAKQSAEREMLAALKPLPAEQQRSIVDALFTVLNVAPPPAESHFMSWAQVREMAAHGVSFQPHTVSHPRISGLDQAGAAREIEQSSREIAEHIGQPGYKACAFAYPFGLPGDYHVETLAALRTHDIRLAFTLTPGPVFRREAERHLLEIPRILILHQDTFEVFLAKVMGIDVVRERGKRLYVEQG